MVPLTPVEIRVDLWTYRELVSRAICLDDINQASSTNGYGAMTLPADLLRNIDSS